MIYLAGKAVGSLVVTASILIVSLPLPLLIGNFLSNYTKVREDPTVNNLIYNEEKSNTVQKGTCSQRQWWSSIELASSSSSSSLFTTMETDKKENESCNGAAGDT